MSPKAVVPEIRPGADVGRFERGLGGPDVLAEPRVERLVVGVPPEERHRGVGVCVDEAGNDDRVGGVERLLGRADEVGVDVEHRAGLAVDEDVPFGDGPVGAEDEAAGDTERLPCHVAGCVATGENAVGSPDRDSPCRRPASSEQPWWTVANGRHGLAGSESETRRGVPPAGGSPRPRAASRSWSGHATRWSRFLG
jgi:hypothetical protein